MGEAFRLAAKCDGSAAAFSVGSIIADLDRQILSTGYSRELGEGWHAEEVAIHKARENAVDFGSCILYSTLEPCGERSSRPVCCSQLIAAAGIPVVMYAVPEPDRFVKKPRGHAVLQEGHVSVHRLSGFEDCFLEDNRHIARKAM
jgi:pyrimidine deaminase RibD-like protein